MSFCIQSSQASFNSSYHGHGTLLESPSILLEFSQLNFQFEDFASRITWQTLPANLNNVGTGKQYTTVSLRLAWHDLLDVPQDTAMERQSVSMSSSQDLN
jgi:hypothetical protein